MGKSDLLIALRNMLAQTPPVEPSVRQKHRPDAWCDASVTIRDLPFGTPERYEYRGCRVCGWVLRRLANRAKLAGTTLSAQDAAKAGFDSPDAVLRAIGRR